MRILQLRLVLRLFLLGSVVVSFPGLAQTEAQSHADNGIQFARAGDLVRAADELRKAVMLAPTNAELLSTLGTVLAMDKKLEESTTTFRKALQLAPQDAIVRRYLAANLWQLHRYSEAKRELQIILREHPDDAQARLLLGMVSENSGDYVTTANMLSSVLKEVEKQPESIAALARSYYYLHDREKARATLQMLTSHASSVQSVLMGAQIADQAGDYEKAEQLLDSIGDSSDGENVRYRKATVQYHRGHFADCEQTLHPVLDRPGASAATYNLLG
ncbi:MAG TPA: tetratricopeptide repeat protein, partial [Terriglobales bacterium]|nr:tetratricopeptide repeat protein [Terriglobales bacterium]